MIINAYETTIGKTYSVTEKTVSIVSSLSLMDRLNPTKIPNVYYIDHTTVNVSPFSYPLTFKDHTGQYITVYDKRPFINKSNKVINQAEANMFKLCAALQQAVVNKETAVLKTSRYLTIKGFVGALSSLLVRRGGLTLEEKLSLDVILAHYWICISEQPTVDRKFITNNVCKEVLHIQTAKEKLLEVEDMTNIKSLLEQIHQHPALWKLKVMDFKDFLTILSKLSLSSVGKQVITAAVEAPCLMTALIHTTVNNNLYFKTPIGLFIENKNNKNKIEELNKTIGYAFDLRD